MIKKKHIKLFATKYVFGKNLKFLKLKNHPFVVPVITFIGLFFLSMIIFVGFGSKTLKPNDARVVIVSYDKKQQVVPTRANTVAELLERLEITVNEGDVVEPTIDTPIVEDNFRVNVYRARPVTIVDEGKPTLAFNAASTPRSIATQAGVIVYAEDKVEKAPVDNILKDGIAEQVIIDRAVLVNLNLYGTMAATRTHATTVGELLKEKNITLSEGDTVKPAESTALTPNLPVFVTRSGTEIVSTEEGVDFEVQYIDDSSLSFGTTAVRQQGSAGKKLVTYEISKTNDVETGRRKIQEVTIEEPVKQIIARGKAVSIPDDKTVIMAAVGIPESDYPYVNYIISRESGWCATKWQGQIGYCPAYYQEIHPIDSGFGYGLCQSTPANKMASAGADWQTNAITQLRWCNGYAVSRYGSWEAAYNFWSVKHYW